MIDERQSDMQPTRLNVRETEQLQTLNEKTRNKLLDLGGGQDLWNKGGEGKRFVAGNVNLKPSRVEDMYEYDDKQRGLDRRVVDDFPKYIVDEHGNPYNPLKPLEEQLALIRRPDSLFNQTVR